MLSPSFLSLWCVIFGCIQSSEPGVPLDHLRTNEQMADLMISDRRRPKDICITCQRCHVMSCHRFDVILDPILSIGSKFKLTTTISIYSHCFTLDIFVTWSQNSERNISNWQTSRVVWVQFPLPSSPDYSLSIYYLPDPHHGPNLAGQPIWRGRAIEPGSQTLRDEAPPTITLIF